MKKVPLRYQISEYDCVPTTFLNALSYIFDRKEIPPEVIKMIMLYSLDSFDKNGEAGKGGTTGIAIRHLCEWLNYYLNQEYVNVVTSEKIQSNFNAFMETSSMIVLDEGDFSKSKEVDQLKFLTGNDRITVEKKGVDSTQMKKYFNIKKGFTLIELILVISAGLIISFLSFQKVLANLKNKRNLLKI